MKWVGSEFCLILCDVESVLVVGLKPRIDDVELSIGVDLYLVCLFEEAWKRRRILVVSETTVSVDIGAVFVFTINAPLFSENNGPLLLIANYPALYL